MCPVLEDLNLRPDREPQCSEAGRKFPAALQPANDYGCARWNLVQRNKLRPGHEFNVHRFLALQLGVIALFFNLMRNLVGDEHGVPEARLPSNACRVLYFFQHIDCIKRSSPLMEFALQTSSICANHTSPLQVPWRKQQASSATDSLRESRVS